MTKIAAKAIRLLPAFRIKSLLVRPRVAQILKWIVYLALVVNFGFYACDDWMAYRNALASDAPWSDVFEQFATTIDTLAWLGLILLFELETHALPDEAFKPWVTRTLHSIRVVCYVGIAYGAYGYTAVTLDNYDVAEIDGLTGLCQIADRGTALQTDSITYVEITSANCATLSTRAPYYRISDDVSLIDGPALEHVQHMGWIDVSNAFVWLIVVLLIEVEVRMQAEHRSGNRYPKRIRRIKSAFYGILITNGIIWTASGYPLYAWDAFLWLVGFWAIELNLAEWEQERQVAATSG